ncbi:hypothetical protein DdX_05010 [Ditylenchus destructor]|uniref:Uncharacterized protein n=1 Tax=Ditylenchus destructor TaxID=166010 RepID=A0AAD4N8W8_9BILA|nr:hypothetical protein DdX_05010 [Ditylenchus destructor]
MWENRALHNLSPSKNGPRPKRRKCFGVEQSKVELRNEGVQRKTQPIIQQKVASATTDMDIHLLSSGHTSILMPCFLALSAGRARVFKSAIESVVKVN